MLLTLLSETQGFPGAADTFWATCQQIQILTSSKATLLYKHEKKAVQSDLVVYNCSPLLSKNSIGISGIYFLWKLLYSCPISTLNKYSGGFLKYVYFRFISNHSYISMFIEILWVFYFRNCQL